MIDLSFFFVYVFVIKSCIKTIIGNLIKTDVHVCETRIPQVEFELIGVLHHMQRYFSHICDGTDGQAD